jgi:hypothetical protein
VRFRPARARVAAGAAIAAVLGTATALGLRARARPPREAVPAPDPAPELPAARGSQDLADVYREARRAFGRAVESPGSASLDDLLERCTTLWFALTMTEPFAGRETKALARATRRLTDLLREHHDLGALPPTPAVDEFVARRRRRLERRIVRRGRELFAAKPLRLAQRLADDRAVGDAADQ